jgi:two-component system, chemotaxis family, sensor kinase Cph1
MRTWRKEVRLIASREETKPLLVRADPIFSSPSRALGFVVLFTDLTDRKAMEAARRKFQEDIIDRQRITTVRLDSRADLAFQNLLSPIIENAQLAALEITDGVDVARMPLMLDSVKASVTRSAELLEQLIWHAIRLPNEP